MLRTCSVCGGIHHEDNMCKRTYKKNSYASKFRNSNAWITKREQIKKRDKYLCQMCLKDNIYTYNNLEIVIDQWPLIPEYMEIEGTSVEEVLNFVKKLNLENCEVTTEDVVSVYKKYGIDILKIKELKEPTNISNENAKN